LFNDDDVDASHPMGQTDSMGQAEPSTRHVPTVDDAKALGKTLAKTIIPDPIVASVRETTIPPVADWVKVAPTLGVHGRKRLCIATRRSDQGHRAAQVITHNELPPYRRPRSPLDMVPSEIVSSRIFEAFCQMS
jgi:hypothetical protein